MSDRTMHRDEFTALDGEERLRRLRRIVTIARLMDTAVGIPFTGIRFGLDSAVGLVPFIGDAAGGLVGLYMVNEARRLGVPAHKLLAMIGNVGVDAAVGSIPILGDVFDVFFKAHRRNADLVLAHFAQENGDLNAAEMKDITPRR